MNKLLELRDEDIAPIEAQLTPPESTVPKYEEEQDEKYQLESIIPEYEEYEYEEEEYEEYQPESIVSEYEPEPPKPINTKQLQVFEFEVVTVELEEQRSGFLGLGSKKFVVNTKRSQSQARYFTEDLGNGVTLDMVYIPGGSFLMGTEEEEIERLVNKFSWDGFRREKPQHKVTVQPFFMGKFQITQAQWKKIVSLPKIECDLEPDPSYFKGEDLPVEQVSWDDAVEFCQRLSQHTGSEYRLPSEAEWEYACRSVISHQLSVNSEELTVEEWNEKYHQPFYFGETITSDLANYRGNRTYANELKGKFREKTTTVGTFPPNAFGLYDMHGNVWEWCQDDWHDNYQGAPTDCRAWLLENSSKKVVRGGCWGSEPWLCRSACRGDITRFYCHGPIGLRVVCVAPRTT